MKKTNKLIILALTAFLLASCTTKKPSESEAPSEDVTSESVSEDISEEESSESETLESEEESELPPESEESTESVESEEESEPESETEIESETEVISESEEESEIESESEEESEQESEVESESEEESESETNPPYSKVESKYTYADYIKNSAYGYSSAPCKGSAKLLVVPVWFTDSKNYIDESKKENVRSDIEKAYFGTSDDTGWESVSSYYAKDSFGNVELEGVVTKWWECNKSSTNYRRDDSGTKTTNLVKSAVTWYKKEYSDSTMKDFDQDGNGYLDGVMLIYGSPNHSTLGISDDNLWAYCYWLANGDANVNEPAPNVFFWASYDFMYSSSTASSRTGHSYGGGDTSYTKIDTHTYIHEMGHVFGLDDYYDYSNKSMPAAGFSMQDMNVGGHDPFSRLALGWVTPMVPTDSCTIDLKPIEDSGDLILLSPNYTGSPFDEYILVEFFTPTRLNKLDSDYSYSDGYPQGPETNCIRIWHIDARLWSYNSWDDSDDSGKITTNPNDGIVEQATSNTTYVSGDPYGTNGYATDLAGSYKYSLNQFIRNNTSSTYTANDYQSSSNCFKSGSSFSISKYKKQFVNSTKFNNGQSFDWTVNVKSISSTSAKIELVKA